MGYWLFISGLVAVAALALMFVRGADDRMSDEV